MITPYTVETILKRAPLECRRDHELNAEHSMVKGCKIGTVFSWKGDYFVYIGINGRNRKFPMIATNVETRQHHKFTAVVFDRVRKASQEG